MVGAAEKQSRREAKLRKMIFSIGFLDLFQFKTAADMREAFLSSHTGTVNLILQDESQEDFVAAMRELLDSQAVIQGKKVFVTAAAGIMINSSFIDALAGFDLQKVHINGPVAYDDGGRQCIARLFANRSLTELGLPWGPELLQALDISSQESCVTSVAIYHFGVTMIDGPDVTRFLAVLAQPSSKVQDLRVPDLFLKFPEFLEFMEDPNCKLTSLTIRFKTGEWQIGAFQSPLCLLPELKLMGEGTLSSEEAVFLIGQLGSFKRLRSLHIKNFDQGVEEEIRLIKKMLSPGSSIAELDLVKDWNADVHTSHSSEIYDALTDPGCKLEKLKLSAYHTLSHDDQERLVDFLDKNSACPLQELHLDVDKWKSDVLKANCNQLMERNILYRKGGLQEQERVKPSSARLFICGASGVGKTTITKNLLRRFSVPGWWQRHESTYGIDIQTLRFGGKKSLVIHDLAGQPEFHAFHHYFVRGSNKDLFLVVCKSPGKGKLTEVQKELEYWLRFIASHRTTSEDRPRVLVALNYFPESEKPSEGKSMTEDAKDACTSITDEYKAYLNIVLVYGLDARRHGQVARLREELQRSLEELLNCTGHIPKICDIIKQRLGRGTTVLDSCLITRREKLAEVVALEELRKRVAKGYPIELIKVALENLHDMGEVIYFPQDQPVLREHLVIVGVQWFVRDIVGLFTPQMARLTEDSVLQEAPGTEVAEEGKIAEVEKKLKGKCKNETHVPYIQKSLEQLGVLLLGEQDKMKVLPLLKERAANWPGDAFGDGDKYWGRRLDCKDRKGTLIPSGVFTMLQVELAKPYKVQVGDGWVSLVKNRISVIVKIGGTTRDWYDRHWIDMLIRIPCDGNLKQERLDEANDLLLRVRKCIIDLCGSPKWGCPALELEEKVLHPEMVEKRDFHGQDVVPLSTVLEEAREHFAKEDYSYTWPTSQRSSYLCELMLPREVKEYLRNKLNSLDEIESELSDCLVEVEDNMSRVTIKRSKSLFGGQIDQEMRMEERLQEILSAVKLAETNVCREVREAEQRLTLEIRKVGNMIRVLKRQGDEILSKLRLGLDENWPKYPFIKGLNQPGLLKKLSKCTVGQTVYLHFLCEEERCHEVNNQAGIEVTLRPEWLKKAAPVLVPALRVLFFTAKVVATVYGGGAIPIPSEDGFIKSIEREGFTALVETVFGGLMDDQTVNNIKGCPATKAELDQLYQEMLQGKNLYKELGLRKKISSRGEVFWVCRHHYSK